MRTLLAAAVLLSLAAPAAADGGPWGAGIILGGPTGVTVAYEQSDKLQIDGAVGIDLINDNNLYIHVEGVWLLTDLLSGGSVGLRPYIGIGGFFFNHRHKKDDDGFSAVGARVPFGLSLDFRKAPLQIFGEAVVNLLLTPDVDVDINGAIGFRYYF